MAKRVCSEPGCPTLTDGGRCADCRRAHEHQRGTRQARGYGAEHDALRTRWTPLVDAGSVLCARCGEPIDVGTPWDLGHDDHDRSRWTGPEHIGCNRATSGRNIRDVT